MDHARDIAWRLQRCPTLDSNACSATNCTANSNRSKSEFVIHSGDGGPFRVTVEDVGYDGLTEEEMFLESYGHTEGTK